jgi:hypothetical protein
LARGSPMRVKLARYKSDNPDIRRSSANLMSSTVLATNARRSPQVLRERERKRDELANQLPNWSGRGLQNRRSRIELIGTTQNLKDAARYARMTPGRPTHSRRVGGIVGGLHFLRRYDDARRGSPRVRVALASSVNA